MLQWISDQCVIDVAHGVAGDNAVRTAMAAARRHGDMSAVWTASALLASTPPPVVSDALTQYAAAYGRDALTALRDAAVRPPGKLDALVWMLVHPSAGSRVRLKRASGNAVETAEHVLSDAFLALRSTTLQKAADAVLRTLARERAQRRPAP